MTTSTILKGDALEILPGLPPASYQSIIADPPYFNVLHEDWDQQWKSADDYLKWTSQWVSLCMRALKDDGLMFCFGQLGKREHVFIHAMAELCRAFQFHDLIIWDRAVGYDRRDSFSPAYEMILSLCKSRQPRFVKDAVREPYDSATIESYARDKRYKNKAARLEYLMEGKFATNILRVPSLKGTSREKVGHPSQKPIALVEKLILCSTQPGDRVLDPFLGSGTTAVAAEMHNRFWTGIEISESYVKIAEERLAAHRAPLFP